MLMLLHSKVDDVRLIVVQILAQTEMSSLLKLIMNGCLEFVVYSGSNILYWE